MAAEVEIFQNIFSNIRKRNDSRNFIYMPIFVDERTPQPFREDLTVYDTENVTLEESNQKYVRDNQIFMDHECFGWGCCSIQVTFQASDMQQAAVLYDQMTAIAPIIVALTVSSPIWRGYLADEDCRWNSLKQTLDDRTLDEKKWMKKTRLDTTDVYISPEGSK